MTAQMMPEHSAAEHYPDADWLDVLSTYSYTIIPRLLERDWCSTPTRPFFLVETAYENEHDTSQLQIRRAAYWSVLGGGNGHVMGNKPIWMFDPGWKEAVSSDGAAGLARWGSFFRSVDWSTLAPDYDRALVSSGRGEARGLNQIGAARSGDGGLAIVYVPERRPLTIEMGVLADPAVTATWFDPATAAAPAGRDPRRGRAGGPHATLPRRTRSCCFESAAVPDEREVGARMPIMTVNGPIEPGELGLTLAHEHIFCDTSGDFREPPAPHREPARRHGRRSRGAHHPARASAFCGASRSGRSATRSSTATRMRSTNCGGRTRAGVKAVIDPTPIGLGRMPEAQRRLSAELGLHVVAGDRVLPRQVPSSGSRDDDASRRSRT